MTKEINNKQKIKKQKNVHPSKAKYIIIREYIDKETHEVIDTKIIKEGITFKQAKKHCNSKESKNYKGKDKYQDIYRKQI